MQRLFSVGEKGGLESRSVGVGGLRGADGAGPSKLCCARGGGGYIDGNGSDAEASSTAALRGPSLAFRSLATVWSEDLTRPLLTVGIGDAVVSAEAMALIRAHASSGVGVGSRADKSSKVVLVNQALSLDGTLSLRVEGTPT